MAGNSWRSYSYGRYRQSRKSDFRRGKKLGIGDHIVTWSKPKRCPPGMSQDEFAKLPEQVKVREIHLLIRQKGFRSKEIIIVTTLIDAKVYTKAKLAQLYQWRWLLCGGLTPCENYFGYGDVAWENSRNGSQGNLCASDGLQLVANRDVAGRQTDWGLPCAYFFARHSSAF